MSGKSAILSYHATKNCFVNLPRSWQPKLSKEKLLVFELQTDGGSLYTSWAGGVSVAEDNGLDTVQINGLFAIKQQLSHQDEVLVCPVPTVSPCTQVYVEPVSITDWEILEESAEYIEGNLLQQVRVVWLGQVIPIWVKQSICIFVKIGKTVPSTKCCLLEENTEVIVAPKARNAQPKRPARKAGLKDLKDGSGDSPKLPPAQNNGFLPTEKKMPTRLEPLMEGDSKRARNLSGNKFVENLKKAATTYDEQLQGVSAGSKDDQNDDDTNAHDDETDVDSHGGQQTGVIGRTFGRIRSWWGGGKDIHGDQTEGVKPVEKCYVKELVDYSLDCKLRVQSLNSVLDHDNDQTRASNHSHDLLLQQISNVFVSYDTFQEMFNTHIYPECTRPFLATVTKLLSPMEREEAETKSARTKLSVSKQGSTLDKNKSHESDWSKLDDPSVKRSVIVRVVVVGDNKGRTKYRQLDKLKQGHILISDILRSQFDMHTTAMIRFNTINHSEDSPRQISFHPLFTLPSGFTRDMLQTAVTTWIESCSDLQTPYVINQASVVRIPLKPDFSGAFLVTFPPSTSSSPREACYCLLNERALGACRLVIEAELPASKLPERLQSAVTGAETRIDLPVPRVSLHQLGGVSEVARQAMQHIDLCLCERPLVSSIMTNNTGLSNGGLLLCGMKGVGKSSLTRALCKYAAEWPNTAYISVMDCKGLKGKRIENLRKMFERVFQEAIWREPSVVLLDDLDHVTAAPAGPEQEMSGEALYYTRVAEVLKDIMSMTRESRAKVVVMATSRSRTSIHPSLVTSRGTHLLQEVIDIPSPDQKARVAILQSILTNKPVVSAACLADLDLEAVAAKTEGYVAKDLNMMVDRTIHAHHMLNEQTDTGSTPEISLCLADFEVGLDGFTPAALKNVSLHKPGEAGWTDVGGLYDVRNTLVETLQWPTKYPKLFSSCPLRLRSGLLLYGAPGTGKTLLAGVVAKECNLNFISIKGPELLSKYIGASEQAVRDTFNRAQSAKPCVLFFDEFDSLAPRRGHDSTGVTDRVVNQLLTQLDGVEGLEGVYVLGATSRPDLIDPALLRPGRLDKALHCPMPSQGDRLEILNALTRHMTLDPTVDLEHFAVNSEHFTGADFKALLYNAQLEAIHELTGSIASDRSVLEVDTNVDQDLALPPPAREGETLTLEKTPEEGNTILEPVSGERSVVLEKRVVLIPNLEEGSVNLSLEKEQQYLDQWSQSVAPPGECESKRSCVTMIKQCHLVKALEGMGPSVSVAERHKYQMIYRNFIGSRGGDFNDSTSNVGQKATLA